jgi:hypothetical protein
MEIKTLHCLLHVVVQSVFLLEYKTASRQPNSYFFTNFQVFACSKNSQQIRHGNQKCKLTKLYCASAYTLLLEKRVRLEHGKRSGHFAIGRNTKLWERL